MAPAASPTLPPAARRRVHLASTVGALCRKVSVVLAGLAMAASGAGLAVPAYAEAEPGDTAAAGAGKQPLQTLTIAGPRVDTIQRDSYTVYLPPTLQYPISPGVGITSAFGPRGGRMHEGVDIFPGAGTPIHSMAAGTVVAVNRPNYGAMGEHVVVEHVIKGERVTSVYGHMMSGSIAVTTGQHVRVGQVLGAVGATGNAQGAHLHFEVRPGGGAAVNPYAWIAARL